MAFGKSNVETLIKPTTSIKSDVTLTNMQHLGHQAFIQPPEKIKVTENGRLYFKKTEKSNIDKLEKTIDRKCSRDLYECKIVSSNFKNQANKTWIDGFGRDLANKIQNTSGETYKLRGDFANNLFLEGNILIQCIKSDCNALLPNQLNIDLQVFSNAKKGGS